MKGDSANAFPVVLQLGPPLLCSACDRYVLALVDDQPFVTCCCFCGTKVPAPKARKETIQ